MIAFFDAIWLNSAMRLRTVGLSASHLLATLTDRLVPHAACASAWLIPIARARQYASCSFVRTRSNSCE